MGELGNNVLGTGLLGGTVVRLGMGDSTQTTATTSTISVTSKTSPDMGEASPTVTDDGSFSPVILDPKNVDVRYNKSRGVFESSWLPTDTFNDSRDQLLAVVSIADDGDDVTVVIERDLNGDETADIHSNKLTVNRTTEIARADPQGESGRYRLVFPQYNQTDVVEQLNVAITYDNTERLIENIPYQFLRNDIRSDNADGSDDIEPLISALGDTLDLIDASIDAVYDNRFVQSARGQSLNKLGRPVGIHRRDVGNTERSDDLESDERLRKRVLAARGLVGLDTTTPSFSQLLALLFPDGKTGITIDVLDSEPVAAVTIPQNVIERHPLTVSEVEHILEDGNTSSYGVTVIADGTFDFTTESTDENWNEGPYIT